MLQNKRHTGQYNWTSSSEYQCSSVLVAEKKCQNSGDDMCWRQYECSKGLVRHLLDGCGGRKFQDWQTWVVVGQAEPLLNTPKFTKKYTPASKLGKAVTQNGKISALTDLNTAI